MTVTDASSPLVSPRVHRVVLAIVTLAGGLGVLASWFFITIAIPLAALAAVAIGAGVGLLLEQRWGRLLAIVVALGVGALALASWRFWPLLYTFYALWVLTRRWGESALTEEEDRGHEGSKEDLDPLEAASWLREMEGEDSRLQARVHGLTWMLWGVVASAIFLTYAYAARTLTVETYGLPPMSFGFLWVPWAVLGLLLTWFLWRSVGFVIPDRALTGRELAVHAGLFLVATAGLAYAAIGAGLLIYPPILALAGVGLVTSGLGVRSALAGDRVEGWFQALVGVVLIAVAVSEPFLLAGPPSYGELSRVALWNTFASAIGLTLVGLVRVLRS